jgi:hypothetical protein
MQGGQRWQARPACPIAYIALSISICLRPQPAAAHGAALRWAMGHRDPPLRNSRASIFCVAMIRIHVVGKKGTFWTLGVKIEL